MTPSQHLGEIVAGHRLGRDTLILLGWSAEDMPSQGTAVLQNRQNAQCRFGSVSVTDSEQRRWFLLIIHGGEAGLSKSGEWFHLQGANARVSTTAYAPSAILEAEAFAAEMLARLGPRTSEVTRLLLDLFPAMSAAPESVRSLIAASLHAAADEIGMVETIGRADGNTLLLQGWISDPHKVEPRLLIDSGILQEHAAAFGTFSRPDLAAPASGFAALVRLEDQAVSTPPRQVYIRSDNRYHRLTVLPNVVQLRDEDVPSHLSGLTANLRLDAASLKVFQAASQSRFTGQDTVSSLPVPVRMAVDLTARAPGAGWYVTGWLLDPLKLVSAVLLRGPGGMCERIDTNWTRLPREDVSGGFRSDPLFDGRISDDLHGFATFVPGTAIDSQAWIELDLGSRGCAFMPTTVTTIAGMADRKRLLATIDLYKPSATEIIERQLGPLFHARGDAPKTQVGYRVLRESPRRGRTALIVPMTDASIKSNIVVSHLAGSRIPADVQMIFVCSPVVTDVLRRLPRELEFYDLAADVLVTDEPVDSCEAMEIGAEACDAANLAFLSPRVHALTANWLVELIAVLGDGLKPCAVSPTLLYEDGSVRYAGIDAVEFSGVSPYAAVVCGRAGYPRGALPRVQTEPTFCGVIECCAMTRSAFDTVGGFSQGYALDLVKGIDLFLRMGAAGVSMMWAASVELYALDDLQANTEHSALVGTQVDGWSFKTAWQNQAALAQQGAGAVAPPLDRATGARAAATPSPIRRAAAE